MCRMARQNFSSGTSFEPAIGNAAHTDAVGWAPGELFRDIRRATAMTGSRR
jgi:hypothetical protein